RGVGAHRRAARDVLGPGAGRAGLRARALAPLRTPARPGLAGAGAAPVGEPRRGSAGRAAAAGLAGPRAGRHAAPARGAVTGRPRGGPVPGHALQPVRAGEGAVVVRMARRRRAGLAGAGVPAPVRGLELRGPADRPVGDAGPALAIAAVAGCRG